MKLFTRLTLELFLKLTKIADFVKFRKKNTWSFL